LLSEPHPALVSPLHHPSAQALANLMIGDCSPGAALLLSRHVGACPQCTARVQAMGALVTPISGINYEPPQALRPGVEIARVAGASGLGEAVFRLRAGRGEPLDLAEPYPVAEILILEGGVMIGGETYVPGDFLAVNERATGEVVGDPERGCVCLITCLDGSAPV
jgi:anti-sigma factor ChrR (cupin superfamily)